MTKQIRDILRLLRPRQWVKNFAIFAAITFTGELFDPVLFIKVAYGFVIFCAISSAIYVTNDLFDIKKDRLHPFKKFRPLANGDVSKPVALTIITLLTLFALIASFILAPGFFLVTLFYLLLQLSYTILFKHITVVDILALAGGYILRVYAGEVVSGFHISAWLLLTTISLSLFLVVAKRRSELTLISNFPSSQIAATRKTLSHYSEKLLDVYASMFATSTFISYTFFTFLEKPRGASFSNDIFSGFLPVDLQKKWLMVTIIPVAYILMRYLQDVYEKQEGESPERVIFSDKPLLSTVILWGILVVIIIYYIQM